MSSTSSTCSTRLNVFQRIMRLWDEVHPYNAAQIMHLQGVPDLKKLAPAWNQALASLGLGHVYVDGDRFRHELTNGHTSAQPIRVVEPATPLEDFISAEMNRPFDAASASGPSSPFRPFILARDGSYYAGVIYHHWIADSASIRILLREWLVRIFDPSQARTSPVRIPAGGYWRFFGPSRAGWELPEGILSTLRSSTRFCNARRIRQEGGDFRVRYSLHPLPDGMIDELVAGARRQKVTLNDVFLAAMARACDRHGATPPDGACQELALGSIVDLRAHSHEDLSDTFGLFLGFTTVIVRPRALKDSAGLLQNIARQNTFQKSQRAAEMSVLRMAGGLARAQTLTPEQRVAFYRKWMPLAAGVSNVNMNRTWAAAYHPSPLLEYIRVTPTGPMLPLVFTTTTLGNRFHVALTRRDALVDDPSAGRLVSTFLSELAIMASNGR